MSRVTATGRHSTCLRGGESLEHRRLLLADGVLTLEQPARSDLDDAHVMVVMQASDGIGNSFRQAFDAGVIRQETSVSDSIGGTDPADVIRFTIDQKQKVTLILDNLTQDADLFLYNDDAQQPVHGCRLQKSKVDNSLECLLSEAPTHNKRPAPVR